MEYTVVSRSEEETRALGEKLAKSLPGDVFIALDGDLGAGKTVFVKGFAAGLGIRQNILSPTFTLLREYEGETKLSHFDVYRIEDEDELLEIGFEETTANGGAVIVEWANRIPGLLPDKRVSIEIRRNKEENTRIIQIQGAPEYEGAVRSALC
jgi:tRNA threonylcarbamoyladenosine biosynthesis protein TsaE